MMDSSHTTTGNHLGGSEHSSRSRVSTKIVDDVTCLTSFNPFSEEDEHDQSSYALVTSLFSKVKNTLAAPLSSAVASTSTGHSNSSNQAERPVEQRRPTVSNAPSNLSGKSPSDRLNRFNVAASNPAPPMVSLTPVVSETPSYNAENDRPPSRSGSYYSPDTPDGGVFGTAIPGFPIPQDSDARSVRTATSLRRSASVSKVIRRIRGEGLSRDYWMDDELCKECYDCKSVFTAWRRKHHCRICGQVFCSRCASNIIKGARFGHNGMVRVCNLCLEKLAKVDDDDDDDRRSVTSSVTASFAAHQLGGESLSFLTHHPQSPFAASHMFGRSDEPFNLFSIAETKRRRDFDDDGSRPLTPLDENRDRFSRDNPVPFRRAVTEEERDTTTLSGGPNNEDSPTALGVSTPVDFPKMVPVPFPGSTSSIQFPISSPEQGGYPFDSPGVLRSRYNSYADLDAGTPIRSRVHSHSLEMGEPGWRIRRESTAYAQELNLISMFHLRIMLRQMLTAEQIPNIAEWEQTLLRLGLRIARELTFTSHLQGEGMDVRRFVKIKKIPGGSPRDSEYVDGAVITKNVAHKKMLREQRNPRVMLVTFPLEFHRVEGQYMHFAQLHRQEKDYLGNLASRIAALRPHVVLAEKSVSRVALDALAGYKIAVARSVKPSAIQFVARMTQGDVFSSMDKLALEPRFGNCARFRIQTFDHPLIPGRRKTYMRFEGCNSDMGCTIVLRGGDIDTLRRIKKVTRFLAFIVRNLRLETHLWKDSVITLPPLTAVATPITLSSNSSTPISGPNTSMPPQSSSLLAQYATSQPFVGADEDNSAHLEADSIINDLPGEEAEQLRLSRRIQESLEPYQKTFISVSATLRFHPPYPIRRMKELDDELMHIKREWEDDVIRRGEHSTPHHQQEETVTQDHSALPSPAPPSPDPNDIAAQIESLAVPDIPATPIMEDNTANAAHSQGYFDINPTSSSIFASSPLPISPIPPPVPTVELPAPLVTAQDIALESRLSYVKWQHAEQRRIWEWYLRKNRDDFDVEKYQCISLWETTIPMTELGLHRACFPPQLRYITFYGENDRTLGQYIHRSVMDSLARFHDPKGICENKSCNLPLSRHCTVFTHNETRLFVAVERWEGQIKQDQLTIAPSPEEIITWSACRVCGSATPFIPVSLEMQRYSFAKFLELHFYPADVQLVQGAGCHHNIYQHHIRYFAIPISLQDSRQEWMTVRFQADPIVIHEVVYPPMRIRVRPETQLEIRNTDFVKLHQRNSNWYTALVDDLKLINIDAATGDDEADARLTTQIKLLIQKAEAERAEIAKFINDVYNETPPTDTLALNQIRAFRQDKIVAWQQDFDKLPRPKVWDRASRKTSAFGSVRAMFPRRSEYYGSLENQNNNSEAEDNAPITRRRVTGDSFASTSSASDASETESIAEKVKPSCPNQDSFIPVAAVEATADALADAAPKSDPDSDSTIGANRVESAVAPGAVPLPALAESDTDRSVQLVSRLPRRSVNYPSVSDLVKKYQDYLPPQGVEELSKTALAPPVPPSENEQDPVTIVPSRLRNKSSRQMIYRKSSMSDFESSYAANIAPRYLMHSRKPQGMSYYHSRIPGPIASSFESREPSRRTSPDKRSSAAHMNDDASTLSRSGSLIVNGKRKGKSTVRSSATERAPSRPTINAGSKSTLRKQTGTGNKVSNIAKHFERIGRDNERASRRYAVIRGRRPRPVASASARVEVLESIKDAIRDESESSDSSEADDEGDGDEDTGGQVEQKKTDISPISAPKEPITDAHPASATVDDGGALPSEEPNATGPKQPLVQDAEPSQPTPSSVSNSPILKAMTHEAPPLPSPAPELDVNVPPGNERHSILKAFSGFWNQPNPPRHRADYDGDDPMSDPEHIFRDSSMVVRTDEPTSIIALALNSPQYREMLLNSRAEKRYTKEPKLTDGGEAFMPDDKSVTESTSTWGVVNVESSGGTDPTEELRVPSSKQPWAISFESGGLTISCTVLFPEQFDALRRTYDCDKSMIESLARCVKWDASGGKSGSAFLKTLDDRFIAKELSRAELQAMETFAPAYFDYMSSAVVANRPTLLAKIFGCFKITFRKTQRQSSSRYKAAQMNLLVMENLFYDRRFSKIYDLKGSTRNRHVQSTGRENEVLLDENLVETAHLMPFYLREHSKRILRGSLFNDSKFLADINVMDYSLVVGVDSKKNELVVGIVDYIRTYTWDKKLESWVKDSTFLGGGHKGEPTIIGPEQYRKRFLSAMERYFPLVPDRWMKQHDAPEEDGNALLDLWPDW